MVIIELKDVELYAYHGVGEAERVTGCRYLVNTKVSYEEKEATFENLKDTINYVTIFNIVRQRMAVPSSLLEQVAADIIQEIQQQFNTVNEIECSIYKIQAPIEYLKGKVGITLHKKFND
jgi:dihydroneopterin aldolase